MKHGYKFLFVTMAMWLSALAVSAFDTRPVRVKNRAAHPANVATPFRIKAGADGSKQLYGMALHDEDGGIYAYGGPVEGYSGPVAIHADGQHVLQNPAASIQTQAGCYYDGKFLSIFRNWQSGAERVEYAFYDADTWERVGLCVNYTLTSPNVLPSDLAYDPTTKRIYGCFLEDTQKGFAIGTNFGYIDVTQELENFTEPVKVIKDLGIGMRGMASTADGVIYGIGEDGNLYTIDKLSGALAKVGEINFPVIPTPDLLGYDSAEIDWETGDIYFFYFDEYYDTRIVKIDPATASAETAADFSYDSGGNCEPFPAIFFKQQATSTTQVPEKVTDIEVTPEGTDLAARFTFTMPRTDTDGNALSGDVTWNVMMGETVIKSGTAQAGGTVNTSVEVAERGLATFVIYASINGANGSPQVRTVFLGNDTPVLPSNPLVMVNGTTAQLMWGEAVAEHEDYKGNLADVTYRVVRNPDNAVLAEAATNRVLMDVIDSPVKKMFSYTVTPQSGGFAGEARSTREFYAGNYFELPLDEDFSNESRFNEYPVCDANSDNTTWWIDLVHKRAVYSSGNIAADDYLCVGPFNMTAGAKYNFYMTANGHNVPENISVWAGSNPADASTFNHEVVPSTVLNAATGTKQLEGHFIPSQSGLYYFGIHAESGANSQNIYVTNVRVTETGADAPVAPESLKAVPADEGMVISCVLPDKTLSGKAAGLTSVCIYRDNLLLANITEGVADGAAFSWTDTDKNVKDGAHRYSVTAGNAAGEGEAAVCDSWWGIDRPGKAVNFRVFEDLDKPGLVHIQWEAPEAGIHGGKIDPNRIEWVLDWLSLGAAGSGITTVGASCKYDLQLPAEAVQAPDLIAFTVYGQNYVGSSQSDGRVTRSAYIGPAQNLPLRESWPGFTTKSGIWSGERLTDDVDLYESWWDLGSGSGNIMPQDDDCMYFLSTTVANGGYRLRSPRLCIDGESNPALVFYLYTTPKTADFYVEIAVDDKPMQLLRSIEVGNGVDNDWRRIEIPLSEYKDCKYFQLGFSGHASVPAEEFLAIDNLSVIDLKQNDLSLLSFNGPAKVKVNDTGIFSIMVHNSGSKAVQADAYTVRVTKNGKVADELKGRNLAPDTDTDFSFKDILSVTDPEKTVYSAEIVFAADENTSDNVSAPLEITVVQHEVPTVHNLTADTKEGVTLHWDEPLESEINFEQTTESFETYTKFTTTDMGDWTLYDKDGHPTVILATALGVLNYPNIGTPMAWQVIDADQAGIFHSAWVARSGNNFLASFQACLDSERDVPSNDWLVSPELYGGPQRISFMATSGSGGQFAPETADILYSTTGNAPEDFMPLASDVEIPYNAEHWNEFTYNLPDGTRYFAIVHKSVNKLALLLDDVKFIGKNAGKQDITVEGYNIYRDGVRINEAPVATNSYTDPHTVKGTTYTYQVSVVWNEGESPLSEKCVAQASTGIDNVSAGSVRVYPLRGKIRIVGAAQNHIAVYTADGKTVASVKTAEATTDIPAAPGVYIVKVAGHVTKVVVN